MNKLRIACFVLALCLSSHVFAQNWRLSNGWVLHEQTARADKDDAFIFRSSNATIFGPGEKVIHGWLGTLFAVDLFKREIYYSEGEHLPEDKDERERQASFLHTNLTNDGGYDRLESLRNEYLDRLEKARLTTEAEKSRKEYLRAYEVAQSLALIIEFETRYAAKDPDCLIPKLANLKLQLEYQEYLDIHAHADTADKLADFIAKYENNDPDELVPKAQNRLPQMQKQERAERDRLDREMIAEQKRKELDSIASRIIVCNRQTSSAYQAIDREREIAQVSGYENKFFMRQAGEIIVSCRNSVRRDFDDYRKKGGSRSLAELK